VQDSDLRVFDIVMTTEFGTTYNAYLAVGQRKTALFETVKAAFAQEYLDATASLTDLAKIDYLVVNHTEPDHAGSIERLLDIHPDLEIVATSMAIQFLKEIVNRDFRARPVKAGDTLDLGGKTLSFHPFPNLHWPDTMFTYIAEDRALLTCDAFGAHFCDAGGLRSRIPEASVSDYWRAAKYYFDGILGPFKHPHVDNALQFVRGLALDRILPGHGPVLDTPEAVQEVIHRYEAWCQVPARGEAQTVAIPYVSAYGYTRQLAGQIAEGIASTGQVQAVLYDLILEEPDTVLEAVLAADGVLFGTPTLVGDALKPVWDLTASLLPVLVQGKPAAAFGSYGWSGEGVPNLTERLKQLRMDVGEGLRVRFKPSPAQLEEARAFGIAFVRKLVGGQKAKTEPAAKSDQEPPIKLALESPLLRCRVCGATFPAGTTVCPICGVGPDQFEPNLANPQNPKTASAFRRDTDERFLIIGAGVAGVSAAEALRARNATAAIVLLGEEEAPPYRRIALSKRPFGPYPAEALREIALREPDWYKEHQITLLTGYRVAAIAPMEGVVTLTNGARLLYDKLIYALGARPFLPPIPGSDVRGIFALRNVADVRALAAAQEAAREVVVLGGGVLGLEAAALLRAAGCGVSVVEAQPRLLMDRADAAEAEAAQADALAKGMRLYLGARADAVETLENATYAVRLTDGTVLPADLVLACTGIRANDALAAGAGLTTDRGVVVDAHMRTSHPSIYACGDCARFAGCGTGQWAIAAVMGETAGANAAGEILEMPEMQ
jgi:flavorubredoxin/NADPH-dependent 2,4-dienoyl-CoA reductase/sulfur reductase-like enzyme